MESTQEHSNIIQARLDELEAGLAELSPARRSQLAETVHELRNLLSSSHQINQEITTALRESETTFKNLFDFAPNAIIAVDEQGLILQANQQAEALFGYTYEEMIGQPVEALIPESFRRRHNDQVREYRDNPHTRPMGAGLDLYGRRKDGEVFPVDVTLGPIRSEAGLITMAAIQDASGRKHVEDAIRERDQFFRTTLSLTPVVFFKVDRGGDILLSIGASPAHTSGSSLVGRSVYDVYADQPAVLSHYKRALAGESFTVVDEVAGRLFHTSYAPQQDEHGEIVAVVGVSLDITEYKRMTEALGRSEERFRTIFDQATLGVVLLDQNQRVVDSNPAYQEMLGYPASELLLMPLSEITNTEDFRTERKLLDRMYRGKLDHVVFEKRYRRKDGELVWGRVALSLLRDENQTPLYALGMVENITQQRLLQAELDEVHRRLIDSTERERLLLSQELHDGPLQELQAVTFQLSALNDTCDRTELEGAQSILSEISKDIRAICGELRPPTLAPFGLEKAMQSYLNGLQEKHPEIEFKADLMPDGQKLSETLRLALFRIFQHSLANVIKHSGARHVNVEFVYDEDEITLSICDDGQGFRVPRRWVELVRQGHFGLAGAYERAEAIGGVLRVESHPGKGTTITVTAPRRAESMLS